MDERLCRSRTDRQLAGVCGGLAAWLGLDPSLVRIGWVLLALLSGGVFVVIYIVMAVVVPDAPPGWAPRGRRPAGGPDGSGAPGGAWAPGSGTWQAGAGGASGGAWSGPPGGPAGGAWAPGGAWGPGMDPNAPPPGPGAPPTSWPEDWGRTADGDQRRRGEQAGVIAGVVLIALGLWFLVGAYIPVNWSLVWPVAVIALGGVLIAGAARRSR